MSVLLGNMERPAEFLNSFFNYHSQCQHEGAYSSGSFMLLPSKSLIAVYRFTTFTSSLLKFRIQG